MTPASSRTLRLALALALASAVAGASGTAARAEGTEQRFAVRPAVTVRTVASDNAYVTDNDREDEIAAHLVPRVELEYRRTALRMGTDLGADLRLSDEGGSRDDAFFDLRGWTEWEPGRGLLLRISDSYQPQPIRLGVPEDETDNLSQSNLLLAEARWRREGSRGAAFETGIEGSRFTTEGFASSLDLDGDSLPDDTSLQSNYWDIGSFAEVQYGLGRRATVYLRGEAHDRQFDEMPRSDFQELSGLLGARTREGSRLKLDVAIGYAAIAFAELGNDSRLIGRGELDYRLGRGWSLNGLFVQRFTAGAAASDFDETSARLGLQKEIGRRTRATFDVIGMRFRRDDPGADPSHVGALELGLFRQLTQRVQAGLRYRHWRGDGDSGDEDLRQNRVILELTYRH